MSFMIDQSADFFRFGFTDDTHLTSVLANKKLLRTHQVVISMVRFYNIRSNKPKILKLKISAT